LSTPSDEIGLEYKKIPVEECVLYGRKVDPDLNMILVHEPTGDLYLTGKDKIIKKYKCPDTLYSELDQRIKAPPNPVDE